MYKHLLVNLKCDVKKSNSKENHNYGMNEGKIN
jgi:hypothetical protein